MVGNTPSSSNQNVEKLNHEGSSNNIGALLKLAGAGPINESPAQLVIGNNALALRTDFFPRIAVHPHQQGTDKHTPYPVVEPTQEFFEILNRAPLGTNFIPIGVTFKVLAPKAERVELCLFETANDRVPSQVANLVRLDNGGWGQIVEELLPGQYYAYRVHGEFKPSEGKYFDSSRFLIDPYARLVTPSYKAYEHGNIPQPKCVLVKDGEFDWGEDKSPAIERDFLVAEAHVKGLTMLHPDIPPEIRGTYAALAHPAMLDYYRKHKFTALELLPITAVFTETHLRLLSSESYRANFNAASSLVTASNSELVNYWGYNPLSFFAIELGYAAEQNPLDALRELKQAIKDLHAAGIEVILDVVFNHTAEGGHHPEQPEITRVPNLSLRGFDGEYYLAEYNGNSINHTGCGNTLNMNSPLAKQLVIDSLHYWVNEFHVDGFRFDAAPVLGRLKGKFCRGAFFDELRADPILGNVRLIVEPWDMGPEDDRVQQGRFPNGVLEWNGFYRDVVRRFWNKEGMPPGELALAIYGSSQFFQSSGRLPSDSVNAIALHDGMTLRDLTEYSLKANGANGENNRDGIDYNFCRNHGVEGETSDPLILAARRQSMRNMLTTLFLSSGTPMIVIGDERGRTQRGNNNAYCQDNPTSWINWDSNSAVPGLSDFVANLAQFRADNPVLQRIDFRGNVRNGTDYTWINPQGEVMNHLDWSDCGKKIIGVCFSPHVVPDLANSDRTHATIFAILNAHDHSVPFVLPQMPSHEVLDYTVAIDTSNEADPFEKLEPLGVGETIIVPPRAVLVFQLRANGPTLESD